MQRRMPPVLSVMAFSRALLATHPARASWRPRAPVSTRTSGARCPPPCARLQRAAPSKVVVEDLVADSAAAEIDEPELVVNRTPVALDEKAFKNLNKLL